MAFAGCLNMKTRLIILAAGFAGGLSLSLFRASAHLEVSAGVSIHSPAEFYEPLAAHGTWVNVDSYGRCWRPAGVAAGWRPYCNGYWEWTDCGSYWVSDEPWAWRVIITARGFMIQTMAGSGFRGLNGRRPGSIGASAATILDGHRAGRRIYRPAVSFRLRRKPAFPRPDAAQHSDLERPGHLQQNHSSRRSQTRKREFDGRTQSVMINDGPRVETVEKATGQKFTTVSVLEADRKHPIRFQNKSAVGLPNPQSRQRRHPVFSNK